MQQSPKVPWSSTGVTLITFSTASYNNILPPSWVKINPVTGGLNITAPQVLKDTEFDFYINSDMSSVNNPIQQVFRLKIIDCAVQNWEKWSTIDTSIWAIWNIDYSLESGSCVLKTNVRISSSFTKETAKVVSITTQSIIGATMLISVGLSMFNTTSFSSLWFIINQMQTFFLLILTRAFIPDDVITAITGPTFAINPFGYIPILKFNFLRKFFRTLILKLEILISNILI